MARTQFTFTFTDAQPGSGVHFSAPVFADADTSAPDGPTLVLDSDNSVSVYADAGFVIATTVDGNGQPISATATASAPSVSTDEGTAGHNPFPLGTSGTVTYRYTGTAAPVPTAAGGGVALTGVASAPTETPSEGAWDAAVGAGTTVACAKPPAGSYLWALRWLAISEGADFVGLYVYSGAVNAGSDALRSVTALSPQDPITPGLTNPGVDVFTTDGTALFFVAAGADNADAGRTVDVELWLTKIA